jgi:hypothetical protein
MFRYYTLLTLKDIQKDEASIIDVLTTIKNNELPNDITLLNYYRELPVNFPASIESIDRGVVQMKVHDMQIASMLIQKKTFIKSSHLPYGVITNVVRLNKTNCIAYLTQFSYVRIHADQRIFVRVKVTGKYDAVFYSDTHRVRGHIEDISFSGVAIKAPKESIPDESIEGTVSLYLPGKKLEVPGKLLKVQEESIYVFELVVDEKSEKVLSHFIFQQQCQIIRELKEITG